MAKLNLKKILDELDKVTEEDIEMTYQQIKEFIHAKYLSFQKITEEKANRLQENIEKLIK